MARQLSTGKSQPRFSIVIVVRDDRGISATLAALQPMVADRIQYEVIVVDASAPATLRDIADMHSWVRWSYFTNTTGKRFTITEQRNAGTALARGEVLVFLDANCVPADSWCTALETAFDDEQCQVITGPITSVGGNTLHDAGYRFADNQVVQECGAANLAVRRAALRAVGGFDENMSYGEDVDLAWRLTDAGYPIIYRQAFVIAHDWGEMNEEKRRAFRYGAARSWLYRKHPHRLPNVFGYDINVLIYPLFIVLLPLTWWFPFYPLLILVPIVKNYRNHPLQKTWLHILYGLGVLRGLVGSSRV